MWRALEASFLMSLPSRRVSTPALILLPHHQALIDASAISPEVAGARGYFSVTEPKQLVDMFGPSQRRAPALVIPVINAYGERQFFQLRPDNPRVKNGRILKYESPAGATMAIDVPPSTRPHLGDVRRTLWITEGVRKADALASIGLPAVALLGVWNWRGKSQNGGTTALPDWEAIALNDRRSVVICFDSDASQNPGVHAATERLGQWLKHRGAEVSFAYLPPADDGSKVGVDDFLAAGHTREDLVDRVLHEWRPLPSMAARKPKSDVPLVATERLIANVTSLIDRFVILPNRAASLTIALWVMHTWAFDAAHATPYLVIQSPVKRAGKTRLEEVLELVVRDPWRIAAASESAMFRKIDAERPTLLLDEVDALFGSRTEGTEPIRAIINAGNRPGASVARVVGEGAGMTVVDFSVYCPKVLAGINTTRWPDTIVDRSIVIQLKRKKSGEQVERMRYRSLRAETDSLRAALQRWAAEHAGALREANPELPGNLDDRAAEGWEPLFAIAELADREHDVDWTRRTHQAATKLGGDRIADDDAHGIVVLAAMWAVFGDSEVVSTETATAALNHDDDLPFGGYRKGAGLDGRGLARLLKPFGIRSRGVRIGLATPKGYRRDDFTDAWERYCTIAPRSGAVDPPQAQQPSNGRGTLGLADPQRAPDVADRATVTKSLRLWDVADVADRNGKPRGTDANGSRPLTEDETVALILDLFTGSTQEAGHVESTCECVVSCVNPEGTCDHCGRVRGLVGELGPSSYSASS